jgi:hypothetical protein
VGRLVLKVALNLPPKAGEIERVAIPVRGRHLYPDIGPVVQSTNRLTEDECRLDP